MPTPNPERASKRVPPPTDSVLASGRSGAKRLDLRRRARDAAALLQRLPLWFQFRLEQIMVRGSHYRLLLICLGIGALSVLSGYVLYVLELGHTESLSESIWWAFLRLTDPGYLGDDHGTFRRSVSTFLTIAGYVLFMGALVATMTQGLNDQMRRLERGLTPVVMRQHVVVIGFNANTAELLMEITQSQGNVRRFLTLHHASTLRVAVLAEEVGPELDQTLDRALGARYRRSRTVLRSGSVLQPLHLDRVAAKHAAAIVFSPSEHQREDEEASDDAHLLKALTTLNLTLGEGAASPIVVAPVADPLKLEVLERAYPAGRSELIAAPLVLAQIVLRCLNHAGLNQFWDEVLSQQYGSEIYVHSAHDVAGLPPRELLVHFETAVALGKLTSGSGRAEFVLLTDPEFSLQEGDSLVVLGHDHELTARRKERDGRSLRPSKAAPPSTSRPPAPAESAEHQLLIMGWNARTPWLLKALHAEPRTRFVVTVASAIPTAERDAHLGQVDISLDGLASKHMLLEPTSLKELSRLELGAFDTVLVVGSDRLESAEDVDARTLLVYQLITHRLAHTTPRPRLLVELRDPENANLFEESTTEVLATSDIITHMLAQLTLRPERRPVLDALLSFGGPEITQLAAAPLELVGTFRFEELMRVGFEHGLIVLGTYDPAHPMPFVLNPGADVEIELTSTSKLIVLERWPTSLA